MDIGAPYRELARVNVETLARDLAALTEAEWDARPIRRASLAADTHNAAHSIVMRHEWTPASSRRGFQTIQASLLDWAARNKRDGKALLPVVEERNSETWVYTFPDWDVWQMRILPIIWDAVAAIDPRPRGVLNRALFVRLAPGAVIEPHVDAQPLAAKSHRIHVAISQSPKCLYMIDGVEFAMAPGMAYDFNNRKVHGVRNLGDTHRINLMLEYIPNPAWIAPGPRLLRPTENGA